MINPFDLNDPLHSDFGFREKIMSKMSVIYHIMNLSTYLQMATVL